VRARSRGVSLSGGGLLRPAETTRRIGRLVEILEGIAAVGELERNAWPSLARCTGEPGRMKEIRCRYFDPLAAFRATSLKSTLSLCDEPRGLPSGEFLNQVNQL
jgi:hypothetical protein